MEYISIDELNHFNFHDAILKKIDFCDENMIWHLSYANATKENSQNSFDKDMCIKDAEIVFEHFEIVKIFFEAQEVYSGKVLVDYIEAKTAKPDECNDILKNNLNSTILKMEELLIDENKKNQICFIILGSIDFYYLTLSFSKSIIKWDEYCGEAWYEDEKWKRK